MSSTSDPRPNLNLEQQRKRAKELRRAHREGRPEAAERILRHLPRAHGQSPADLLGSPFTLSEAQLVVAREAGFPSWPRLKQQIELSRLGVEAGLEVLLDAAVAGDSDAVRRALAASPDLPRRSIHAAAALGEAEAALRLLDDGPTRATERGGLRQWTPLFYTCSARHGRGDRNVSDGRARIAARLLELGADPNEIVDSQDSQRSVLQNAARDVASVELVDVLLRAGATLEPGGIPESLPLSDAVTGGDRACVERMLAARPESWQAREALEVAVFGDRADIARLLLDYGAHPSSAGRWWGHLGSCLHAAIVLRRGQEMLEVLLASDVDVSAVDRDEHSAYAVAVRAGHEVAAQLLRQRGASDAGVSPVDRVIAACLQLDREEARRLLDDDPGLRARYRYTDHLMLGWAIRNGRQAAVPLLLEAGLDANVADTSGDTPLHLAAAAGDPGTVSALLAAGASPAARDYRGRTPFGQAPPPEEQRERDSLFERAADAVVFGDLEVLRELLDDEPELVHWRSPREHRATLLLYCAANGTEAPRQRTPPNAPAIAQLLLERGADFKATGRFYGGGVGATTIALLLSSDFPSAAGVQADLVEVLCKAGEKPNGPEDDGSPLWTAIRLGYAPAAERLVRCGARVDNLLFAAALGDLAAVKGYFDESGRLKPPGRRGRAGAAEPELEGEHALEHALMFAAGHGRRAVVELLLSKGPDLSFREPTWGASALSAAEYLLRFRAYEAPAPGIDRPGVVALLEPLFLQGCVAE